METFFSLLILTLAYSLLTLSIFPERYYRKLIPPGKDKYNIGSYKFHYTLPLFISFLVGYTLASTVFYFFN
jgi:hypothetical protein